MAVIRNQSYVLHFYAYDSSGNPKTGDASNITVRISKDGGSLTATTNTPAEVDATNAPGLYRITLTATEMDANSILVVPKSSTSGVQCTAVNIITERGRLDAAVSTRAAPGDAMTLTTSERSSVAQAVWEYTTRTLTSFGTLVNDTAQAVWSYTIEASQSALTWMRLAGSVLFGKLVKSGTSFAFRDWNDSKNRVAGTVDGDGNRTISTRDGS